MSKEIVRPIYDIRERILNLNIYPYTTGRVFFDTENQVIYTDIDGQRSARTDLSSIQVLDGDIEEFYENGAKGFKNQIMVGRTPTGFRLYYVDNEAQVHNLTFTAESVSSFSERGVTDSATFYYAGNWTTGKTYTSDAFRIAVVKEGSVFYYARETHVAGATFDSSKWLKFSEQFESVATGLLLAEDAIITRTLTMGTEVINSQTLNGTIKSAGVTNLGTGIGFFLGNQANGVFRVGDPNGNFILWNGTSLTINGGVTVDYLDVTGIKPPANADVTSVVIGNGLVTAGSLVARSGTGSNAAGLTGLTQGDSAVRIFAGSNLDNRASAPFRVTQAGALTATSANITGVITATSGSFTGSITSSAGNIGGFTIDETTLTAGSGFTRVGISPSLSGISFFAGNDNPSIAPFRVTNTGNLTAASGTIGNTTFSGTTVSGTGFLNIGAIRASQLIVDGNTFAGHIIPSLNNTFNLGQLSEPQSGQLDLFWKNIFLNNQPQVFSDELTKENMRPVENEYNNIILNTKIITYNNIDDDKLKIGIGARQFYEQFGDQSEVVLNYAKKGKFIADYVAFIPMMIKTIQAQEKRIIELEKKLNIE